MHRLISLVIGTLAAGLATVATAEEIAVGNYGVSANGMPFGVALVKGYFKDEGLNITGLISSAGGGTSHCTSVPAEPVSGAPSSGS
jgi:NitT/TauT family transport system substrate-binding protein